MVNKNLPGEPQWNSGENPRGGTDDGTEAGTADHDRRAAQALAEYQDSFAAGQSSNWRQFLEEHPDFSNLRDEFEVLDQVDFLFDERSLGGPIAEFGDFALIRVLGDGGMGVVYEAYQVSLSRRVALKIISPQFLDSVKASERFLKREIIAQGRLSHPNIVPIYSTGVEGKTPYFAMEYCKGETLQDWLDRLRAKERARREGAAAEAGAETDDEPVIRELYTPGDGAEFDDLVYDDTPYGGPMFVRTMSDATQYDGAGWDGPGLDGFLPEDRGNGAGVGAPPVPPPESAAAGEVDSNSEIVRPLLSPTGDRDLSGDHCRRVAKSLIGVAHALYHAHVHDVIHRDIKPSNLIFDATGNLRILDFGLALLLDDSSRVTRISSKPMGTLPYMSPEQIQGLHKLYGPAMDLYSLGATLYEMVTGRPPVEATDFSGFLRKIVSEEPEPPSRRNPQVPRKLEAIILRCLEKLPERRYPTAHVLALDLQNFLDGNELFIRPDPRVVKVARTVWKFRKGLFATACALMLAVVSGLHYLLKEKKEYEELERRYGPIVEAAAAAIQSQELNLVPRVLRMGIPRKVRGSEEAPDVFKDLHRGGKDLLFDVQADQFEHSALSTSGDAMAKRAEVDRALRLLDSAVDLLPGAPEAHYYKARGLLLLGEVIRAQEELDLVFDRDEKCVLALGLQLQLFAAKRDLGAARQAKKHLPIAGKAAASDWAAPWLEVIQAEREGDWKVVTKKCEEVDKLLGSDPKDWSDPKNWQAKALKRQVGPMKNAARVGAARMLNDRNLHEDAEELLLKVCSERLVRAGLAVGTGPSPWSLLEVKARYLREDRKVAKEIFNEWYDDARTGRGSIEWTASEVAQAATTFYRDVGDLDEALKWAKQIPPQNDKDPVPLLTIGYILMQQGKHEAAREKFDRAAELVPQAEDARPVIAQALSLNAQGRGEEAEDKLQAVVSSRQSDLGQVYYYWAWLLNQQGEISAAEQKCREALLYDPDNSLSHNFLGVLLDKQDNLERAKEEYKTATDLDPRFGVAHYHLAWAYHRQFLFAEAASHYQRAIDNGITDPVVFGNRAACLQMQGKISEAITTYQEALNSEPDYAVTHLSLGSAYEWRSKPEEDRLNAEASYRRAVELDPSWLRARFYWAGALDRLMRRTDAFDQYAEILSRSPDYYAARQLMASIALEENWPLPTGVDLWKAISQLEDAVALSPDAESAGERMLGMCRRTLSPDLATYGSIDALFDDPEMPIPERARWARWPDSREEPPAGWNAFGFDDRQWVAGPGSFGYPAGIHGIGTALDDMQGSYDSVYLRHRFVVADRTRLGRLILAVRGDVGYSAYLNGVEVARQGVTDRKNADARVGGIAVRCEQYAIDPSLLLDGENVLALHGMNYRVDDEDFFLGATLKSTPVDPVAPVASERAVQEAYAAFLPVASGPTAAARRAFFEGRLHQLSGNHGDAVKSFDEVLASDRTRPEPFLRLADSLVALGRAEEGEAVLRQGMNPASSGYARLFDAWFRCVMLGAGWSEARALDSFPEDTKDPTKRSEVGEGYFWLLTSLKENKAVRINCGGLAYKAGGKSWGRDRFHRGGQERYLNDLQREIAASSDPEAALADPPIFMNERFFDSGAPIMPGYSIPLPRGTYLVTLHFIEGSDEPDKERRRFDVLIEGDVKVPDCEPMRSGYGVPDLHELQVVVEDGALDIEFRRHSTDRDLCPQISAIEIVPVRP